ncbi:hypothetical protein LshimejAT787_0112020 [Lyophyllum shimeji]|uniref:Uncharacterized protein n=1 Tax=Lyophyllum shimeji TaxID=47721 RepID=A0A9P3PEB4_LYOSH|nr:hypothetical protein LshimejAT787_0112020 [Lyophyllum shimeji]
MSWSRNYAPPVSHDSFCYDGRSFYVRVGEHRHPRADPGSLYRLLTYTDPGPLLTKAGKIAKRQPAPHKDSPWHFYQAQCVHYGLPAYTRKSAAKRHLLAAFDAASKTLSVPTYILALEQVLKDEYNEANEVAWKKVEGEQKPEEMNARRGMSAVRR